MIKEEEEEEGEEEKDNLVSILLVDGKLVVKRIAKQEVYRGVSSVRPTTCQTDRFQVYQCL